MTDYHTRIRQSIELGGEADYQQDCLNLLAEIELLEKKIWELEQDSITMALRLLGEHEDTFSPECWVVMQVWGPKAMMLEEEMRLNFQ